MGMAVLWAGEMSKHLRSTGVPVAVLMVQISAPHLGVYFDRSVVGWASLFEKYTNRSHAAENPIRWILYIPTYLIITIIYHNILLYYGHSIPTWACITKIRRPPGRPAPLEA